MKTITVRRAAQIAAKKISLKSDKKIAENLDMCALNAVEAYRAGAEEAQEEIIARFNLLLLRGEG